MIFSSSQIYSKPLLTLTYMSEKSKFLQMFESLPEREKEKVAQAALQIAQTMKEKAIKR